MRNTEMLETLKDLQAQVNVSIAVFDMQEMRDMSPAELAAYKQRFGEFDFVIGNFAVRDLRRKARVTSATSEPAE